MTSIGFRIFSIFNRDDWRDADCQKSSSWYKAKPITWHQSARSSPGVKKEMLGIHWDFPKRSYRTLARLLPSVIHFSLRFIAFENRSRRKPAQPPSIMQFETFGQGSQGVKAIRKALNYNCRMKTDAAENAVNRSLGTSTLIPSRHP